MKQAGEFHFHLVLSCSHIFNAYLFFSFKRLFYLITHPMAGSRMECCLEIKPQKWKSSLPDALHSFTFITLRN